MDILNFVGKTPLVKLKDKNIFVKLEEFNAGGSIKSRVGLQMILDARESGVLKKMVQLSLSQLAEILAWGLHLQVAFLAINSYFAFQIILVAKR